jgi:hypothetical protein
MGWNWCLYRVSPVLAGIATRREYQITVTQRGETGCREKDCPPPCLCVCCLSSYEQIPFRRHESFCYC